MHTAQFTLWSLVMLAACVIAALRLVTFRRGPSRHRAAYGWASWLLVVALTAVAVKVALGVRPPPGPVEAVLSAAMAAVFVAHHGNLAHIYRAGRQAIGVLMSWRLP